MAAAFGEFIDPHPAAGNQFGAVVVPLATGDVVITSPYDDAGGADAGAVYLFNGRTGALISSLTGSHPNDHVGIFGVTELTNGNFVVVSPDWDSDTVHDVGAVTWGNGTVGIAGLVSEANSLIGSTTGDVIGGAYYQPDADFRSGVTALPNGNYVVRSSLWHNGLASNAGAVTFGYGESGVSGKVSGGNGLIGATAGDDLGGRGVMVLPSGNYVVDSPYWDRGAVPNAGAVTWGSGTSGVRGSLSSGNSLVGSHAFDQVGDNGGESGVVVLANGNYVILSDFWSNGALQEAGAATWASGTTGLQGEISEFNSLVGMNAGENVGAEVTALTNGNYVVFSPSWHNDDFVNVGAITWAKGVTGISGAISETNSMVGNVAEDLYYSTVAALANGNYVVSSPFFDNGPVQDAGAVTFGDGASGVHGMISGATSLVGTMEDDEVGSDGVTPLTNGNYVVRSTRWASGSGAATWGDGTLGIQGPVTPMNSLVGSSVGNGGIYALANGNYVVSSPGWANINVVAAGAVTWGDGTSGVHGYVSSANSLVGTTAHDAVGSAITTLVNGNYVVTSPDWDNAGMRDLGAATFGSGASGVVGAVTSDNSLVGLVPGDRVGDRGTTALANGNYVVASQYRDNDAVVDAGAVTFASGVSGISGVASGTNSLVGSTAGDRLGFGDSVYALGNGNYLVRGIFWDNGAVHDTGSITFGSGNDGISGEISAINSAEGTVPLTVAPFAVAGDFNRTFYASFPDAGRVFVGSQIDGFAHHWHLAATAMDVNNDGHVVAGDALAVINYINAGFPPAVAENAQLGGPYGFLDVTGDDFVAANDALDVINAINAGLSREGEALITEMGGPEGRNEKDNLFAMLAIDVTAQSRKR